MYTVGNLVEVKRAGACWYTPGPLTPLAAYLPEQVPEEKQSLRVGRFWKLAYRHAEMKTNVVIKIYGGSADTVEVAWHQVVIGGSTLTSPLHGSTVYDLCHCTIWERPPRPAPA